MLEMTSLGLNDSHADGFLEWASTDRVEDKEKPLVSDISLLLLLDKILS